MFGLLYFRDSYVRININQSRYIYICVYAPLFLLHLYLPPCWDNCHFEAQVMGFCSGDVVKLSWVVLVILVGCVREMEGWGYKISWEDVELDEYDYEMVRRRVGERDVREGDFVALERESGRNRFIVVDGNGRGDSATVQGAVDMIPDYNSRRVKIYVLPGIYR